MTRGPSGWACRLDGPRVGAWFVGPGLVAVLASSEPATAQPAGGVVLEAGTATALPAAEIEGEAALYGMTGVSMDWAGERAAVEAALYGGLALDDARGGDFASAVLRVQAWSAGTVGAALGAVARVYGFSVGPPFPYRNGTVRAGPAVRWGSGPGRVEVRLEAGSGASVVELRHRRLDRALRIDEHLWSVGGVVEGSLARGGLELSATGGAWRSAGGPFRAVEVALTGGGSKLAVRGELGVWDTPLGSEWAGGLALVVPLGTRWSVQAAGGRAGPDPLTLVEGGGQGGVMLGWLLADLGGSGAPSLYELEPSTEGGARVTFRLERPGAERVEILGGFTGWEPRAMRADGDAWTLELRVAPGTHHFGFFVDGEWYVPEGHLGNVPDEWGRLNATLVVPPVPGELEP